MAQHPFKSEGYQGNTPLHCLAASLCEDTTLLKNSRVDKMAIKKENLNVQDIVGANDSNLLNARVSLRNLRSADY